MSPREGSDLPKATVKTRARTTAKHPVPLIPCSLLIGGVSKTFWRERSQGLITLTLAASGLVQISQKKILSNLESGFSKCSFTSDLLEESQRNNSKKKKIN